MLSKKMLILPMVSLVALTACQTPTERIESPNYRAQNGAVAGAVGGALLGAAFSDNKGAGALRGALIGGASLKSADFLAICSVCADLTALEPEKGAFQFQGGRVMSGQN